MTSLKRPLRAVANILGLAWWAHVQTYGPNVTYWFGPFVTRRSLQSELSSFLKDLSSESPDNIRHSLIRCRRGEPFTINFEV
ncbi:hypothetical protein OMCYN_01222 [cyanobiont of Ornithocercus magnificus]|nr:hypothetical protein OMCYN_01222 [cyanobiont of Ornithocercus magnificus]